MGTIYTKFAGLPVPDDTAQDDVPYWLSQLANGLDPKVVCRATSTSDRDSKFYQADPGLLCIVVSASGTVSGAYVKTSAAGTSPTWGTVWEPPVAPTPIPLNLVDGMGVANGKTPVAVYNAGSHEWVLWGNINLTSGGNIANGTTLAYLPAQVAMSNVQNYYEGASTSSVSGSATSGTGKINVTPSTGAVTFYGTATPWVGVDNIRLPAA